MLRKRKRFICTLYTWRAMDYIAGILFMMELFFIEVAFGRNISLTAHLRLLPRGKPIGRWG
jgi:hypothetical protein